MTTYKIYTFLIEYLGRSKMSLVKLFGLLNISFGDYLTNKPFLKGDYKQV